MLTDGDYTYVATVDFDSITGPDIRVIKYNGESARIWEVEWTGSGNGRDQATDMVSDSLYLYICGATYTSSANNYDYLIMQMRKSDGLVSWYRTYNGTSSNYDLATAILKTAPAFMLQVFQTTRGLFWITTP